MNVLIIAQVEGKNILSPKKQGLSLVLCIKICSYVQNFAELVQESWLSKLTKIIRECYINICIPSEGENAAMGARPEAASCQLMAVISLPQTFILHLPESQLTTFHQQVKCCGIMDYFPVPVGRLPQGNFHREINVLPAMILYSFVANLYRREVPWQLLNSEFWRYEEIVQFYLLLCRFEFRPEYFLSIMLCRWQV